MTGETPAELGFRMPAEWEPQQCVWLSWPNLSGESFEFGLETIHRDFVTLLRHLLKSGTVFLNLSDSRESEDLLPLLSEPEKKNLHAFEIPTREPWCRDHGPTFLASDDRISAVKWRFDSWGGKYPPFEADDRAGRKMAEAVNVQIFEPGVVFEGGGFDVDGCGNGVISRRCFFARNPEMTEKDAERIFAEFLGIHNLQWLSGASITGDDTDGHIDVTTRFAGEGRLVAARAESPSSTDFRSLRDNFKEAERLRTHQGSRFEVIRLPAAEPHWHPVREIHVPASYANFLVCNDSVLVPSYAQPGDEEACNVLQQCFPDRIIIPVDCREVIMGQGSLHCLTQQVPAAGPPLTDQVTTRK